ncbi:MAG: DNA-binding protein YbaB [Flavobacteriales bacterium]|jgi:DNA-binding protein YbaB
MLDKLKQLQQMKGQMDEVKSRLDNIQVRGEAEGVVVISNGNRKIVDVIIPESLSKTDIEDLILLATNRALEQAENVFESEMKSVAGGMMGGLGLF